MLDIAESVSLAILKETPHILIAGPVDTRYLETLREVIGDVSDAAVEAAGVMQNAIQERITKPKKTTRQVLDYFMTEGEKKE